MDRVEITLRSGGGRFMSSMLRLLVTQQGLSAVHTVISQAISSRRRLLITYAPGDRVIEPCAYGRSSEQHGLIRGFQVSGASASGEHINWKLFRLDRIIKLEILDEIFASDPAGYRRGDKAMAGGIYCQI